MTQRSYSSLTGLLFLSIAALHLTRVVYGWPAEFNYFSMPSWASWLGLVVAACLAYTGLKLSKK